MARFVIIGMLALLAVSCRQIDPVNPPPSSTITGYQLNGIVTTVNGIPLSGVDVQLFFSGELVSLTPIDTTQVVVHDSTKILDIAVYTTDYRLVRQLFLGFRSPGVVPPAQWNGLDESMHSAPSGKYYIRYVVDTVVVKLTPYLLSGTVTATTDTSGRFTIGGSHLPIGDVFDTYNYDGSFDGAYQVTPDVDLNFRNPQRESTYSSFHLIENQITTGAFVL